MENKKSLKGFTLVELIIVLAIFSVILALVMSFIDPVSNLMKKTSIRERTAAYSDNISEYIDNSLHYARCLYVYEGGFTQQGHPDTASDCLGAINEVVKNNFDGAVDGSKNPIQGKVRIMEFNNDTGRINESVWKFVSGNSAKSQKIKIYSMTSNQTTDINDTSAVPEATRNTIIAGNTRQVLNEEHFENYNYHYSIGYYDFKPYKSAPQEYSSRLIPMKDNVGNAIEAKIENFPINIIAYSNKTANGRTIETEGTPPATNDFLSFKSPCHMSTVSMALINAMNTSKANVVDYYYYDETAKEFKAINGVPYFYQKSTVPPAPGDSAFKQSSFYVVYILPYEIYDTQVELF